MEEKISFSFKKGDKITKSYDFKDVFEKGKGLGASTVALYFILKESGNPRAGFIASKKISKKAVDRNRAKRLMREVFRLNRHKLVPCDIVFIARGRIKDAKYADVEKDFMFLVKKAGILKQGRLKDV